MVKAADSVNLDQPFQEALSLDLFRSLRFKYDPEGKSKSVRLRSSDNWIGIFGSNCQRSLVRRISNTWSLRFKNVETSSFPIPIPFAYHRVIFASFPLCDCKWNHNHSIFQVIRNR